MDKKEIKMAKTDKCTLSQKKMNRNYLSEILDRYLLTTVFVKARKGLPHGSPKLLNWTIYPKHSFHTLRAQRSSI